MKPLLLKAGSTPSYRALLLTCCAVSFGCYVGSYMRIPIIPLFARSLGADTVWIGIINSSFMLVAGVFSIPLGIVSDRWGKKRLALTGLLISAATSLALALGHTPMQILVVYLFSGLGIAAFAPTMMAYVTDISPPTHLGRTYGWYTTALYGGMSVGPAAGGFVAQMFDFQTVFLASGVANLVVVLAVILLLPRAREVRPHTSAPKREAAAVARELLRNKPLLACLMITLGGCFALGVFVTFLPLHAHDQGLNAGQIGLVFGVQAIVNAVSRIPFGILSDKSSDRSALAAVGVIGFGGSIGLFGIAGTLPAFLFGASLMGVSMGFAFTAVGALIAEVVPADSRGLAMGGYNTCIYMGMMLSALTMGVIAGEIGFRNAFLMTGAVNVLAAIAFYAAFRPFARRKRALSDGLSQGLQ
jgi:MFS transporter, DHA1 family, multidrug resistance protein